MKFLIINGPNLNMLGLREPGIYGDRNYATLCALCEEWCAAEGIQCELFQSNHEGVIVDKIQEAYGKADGIVINPAAYTHTSVAILDALKAVAIPTVEVHISKVRDAVAAELAGTVADPPVVKVRTLRGAEKRERRPRR